MRTASIVALFPLTLLAFAGSLDTGAVISSDGGALFRNTIPQVARLGNNNLIAVWSASAKAGGGAKIYVSLSPDGGKTWNAPKTVLTPEAGKSMADPNMLVAGNRIFVYSSKINAPNKIEKTWTIGTESLDNGTTWSEPFEVPTQHQYVVGKQHNGIVLRDGSFLMAIAWDKWPEMGMAARSEGEMDLTAGVLASRDGRKWTQHGALHATYDKLTPGGTNGLCEPSLVELENGEILMILRSGGTHHYQSRSSDGGMTWSTPVPSSLTGHNTPTALLRLQQNPKEIVAVWNNSPLTRTPLSTAISGDGGRTWSVPRILASTTDGQQVSYPGLTQAADGTIVAVWQQGLAGGGREIRYARYTRDWVLTGQ
jgi:hypothetical protein